MKKFIKSLIIFLAIPSIYFGANMLINRFIYVNEELPMTYKNVLIAGDSHPQLSINENYFSNAQNISQTAEPYVLTFWKLKKILNTIKTDTLILGFAPHNISQFNDFKFTRQPWVNEMMKRAYPIIEFDTPLVDYSIYRQVLWKQTAFYPKQNHIIYLSKFSNESTSTNFSKWKKTVKTHYFDGRKELQVSEISKNYLDSIVDLCQVKNISLVLTSHPLHKKYINEIPIDIMEEYLRLNIKYSKSHIVFDRTTDHYPDSLFFNIDHLNGVGAKKFTKELISHLNTIAKTQN
ncbi:hypothetical protein [Winogradskyella sp. 4-2091]|uniref:hypothetical protein n=1 Tax=Winogradskyella sp. 4-2091 TaxID=3381659 RepID=UPI00389207E3